MTDRHASIVPVIVPTGDGGRIGFDPETFAARIRAHRTPERANSADRSLRRRL
ncbi:hypothetical protein [Nocardia macrotermitis]|uniref:hypothetical protein n=1 Tax=Nocardia macrotermitis TaxID=2585198 RepID=UPI001295906C|nr:hypothetical protein [Nocardia macrotermitis]